MHLDVPYARIGLRGKRWGWTLLARGSKQRYPVHGVLFAILFDPIVRWLIVEHVDPRCLLRNYAGEMVLLCGTGFRTSEVAAGVS